MSMREEHSTGQEGEIDPKTEICTDEGHGNTTTAEADANNQ